MNRNKIKFCHKLIYTQYSLTEPCAFAVPHPVYVYKSFRQTLKYSVQWWQTRSTILWPTHTNERKPWGKCAVPNEMTFPPVIYWCRTHIKFIDLWIWRREFFVVEEHLKIGITWNEMKYTTHFSLLGCLYKYTVRRNPCFVRSFFPSS